MRSKRTEGKEVLERSYPRLMIEPVTGIVLLFSEKYHGTIVYGGKSDEIGERHVYLSVDGFADFTGTIELSND